MGNNHGTQTLLNMNHEADEKGLTRARIPGELIYDKLVGQKDSNMISLPSVAAAVLAAAAAAARDLLPHRHRAAWRQRLLVQPALGRKLQLWPGRLAGRFLPRSAWSVSLLLGPMGPVRSASEQCR